MNINIEIDMKNNDEIIKNLIETTDASTSVW